MAKTQNGCGSDTIHMFRPYVTEAAIARVTATLRSGYIGEGPVTAEFERDLKAAIGTRNALALNSCTSALHLALAVAGVGPGDEVVTTAQTMAATSHAILAHYARPVFADIQYETGNIDPADIERNITDATAAVIAVHWAGYPCDMDEILAIAKKYELPVIEDAAHALGATYKGKSIGDVSPFTCFSFQAIKHITTGDGGMLCCTHEADYNEARRRRWYGIDRRNRRPSELGEPLWDMSEIGYKYHMNDIAASMGVEHLRELPAILDKRRAIAAAFRNAFVDVPGLTLLEQKDDRQSAVWLFTIHVEKRDHFVRAMKAAGIEASVVHRRIDTHSVFAPKSDDLPNLARFDETQISLPVHPLLTDDDVARIIQAVRKGW
ncbi:MAG: DegT/DnrJ/EryC1/StrS family aminotransferase [Acidobacteria bacterium]|nr:DegT/DnrJ/EryC1/StrS family aminotransferase [Acidobacteriota bacterium]